LREVETLAATATGAITVGSFTVPEQAGTEARYGGPTYYHDKVTHTTYNSMGLPNIGLERAITLMPEILARAREYGKPVIASVSPTVANEENGDTFKQVKRLVYNMQLTDVDLIEVNTACPNVVTEGGGRKPILGYDSEGMYQLVEELAPWTGMINSKVGVKLPPYITDEEQALVPELAQLFRDRRVFGFITTANAIPNQVARDKDGEPVLSVPGGAGGMSGPSTKRIGRQQLKLWKDALGEDIEIVSTLGVDSGKELAIRKALGAAAAGGVTFLWESDNWGRAVTKVTEDWSDVVGQP